MSDVNTAPDITQVQTGGEGGHETQAPLSLRDHLESAFKADADKQAEGAPAEGPAKVAKAATASETSSETPARNELGQFVKQSDKAAEPKTPSGEPRAGGPKAPQVNLGAEPPKPEAIAPPAAWSPAAKAAFDALPPVVKSEIAKREADWNTGTAQRNQDAERLNRLHQVLAPYGQRFQLAGINEAQAVQQLLTASDYLQNDPVNALIYLARTHGVDPRQFAQVFAGAQGQQPQVPREVQQLYGEVQALKQNLDQERQAARNAQYQQMLDQVATFSQDSRHPYFENVREPMAALIETGGASDLEDAYEKATWGHAEIRPLLIQQQLEEQQRAALEAAKAKAAQARHASGSITGSPSPGAVSGLNGSKLSLREELQKNWNELA